MVGALRKLSAFCRICGIWSSRCPGFRSWRRTWCPGTETTTLQNKILIKTTTTIKCIFKCTANNADHLRTLQWRRHFICKLCRKLRRQLNHFTSRNKADDTLKCTHPHVGVLLDESIVLSLGKHAKKKRAQILTKGERSLELWLAHWKDTIPKILINIPRKGIARLQSQFLHSCVCERFIYSHEQSAYSAAGKYVNRSWEYTNRSQVHECGNRDWGRTIPFLGTHKYDFLCVQHQA